MSSNSLHHMSADKKRLNTPLIARFVCFMGIIFHISPDKKDGKRFNTPDTVRGICVLGMIVYHALFDICFVFGFSIPENAELIINLIRDFGAGLFVFMSGFSFSIGKHHLKHIIVLNLAGILISIVTKIFVPQMIVIFGILNFMGCACLVMCIFKKLFSKFPPAVFAIISAVLFLLFLSVNFGFIGYGDFVIVHFPKSLYKNIISTAFGFPYDGFLSGDYFSFLPWIFSYFCGFFTYRAIRNKTYFKPAMQLKIPFVTGVGKKSFIIYLLHQPIVYGIVVLVSKIIS